MPPYYKYIFPRLCNYSTVWTQELDPAFKRKHYQVWWPACTFPLWITISALILKLIPTGFSWAYLYVSLHRRGKRPQVAQNHFSMTSAAFFNQNYSKLQSFLFWGEKHTMTGMQPKQYIFFSFEKQINTLLQEKKRRAGDPATYNILHHCAISCVQWA